MEHMSQLKVSPLDERGKKRPLPPGSGERADHGAFQGSEIVRSEVCEVAILGMAPNALNRIEIGCVGGQPFDDDPPVLVQPRRDTGGPVGSMPIPNEGETVGQVASQGLQESEDLGAADIVPIEHPVQSKAPSAWGHRERADRREPVPTIPLAEDRGLAARRPGAPDHRLQHEPALIQEDEASAGATSVFLYAASARPATGRSRSRLAPSPGAPASGNSTPRRGGSSRRERDGTGPRRCGR